MIGCKTLDHAAGNVKNYLNLCKKIGVPPVGYGVAIVLGGVGVFLALYLNSLPQEQGDEMFALLPLGLALVPFAMVQIVTRGPFAEQLPKMVIGFALPAATFLITGMIGLWIFHGVEIFFTGASICPATIVKELAPGVL